MNFSAKNRAVKSIFFDDTIFFGLKTKVRIFFEKQPPKAPATPLFAP